MPEKGLLPLAKDIINTCCDVQLLTCHASNLCKLRASCPNLPLAPRPCPQLRSSLLQVKGESAPSALSSWAVNYCRRNSDTRGVCVIILHATPPLFFSFLSSFFLLLFYTNFTAANEFQFYAKRTLQVANVAGQLCDSGRRRRRRSVWQVKFFN